MQTLQPHLKGVIMGNGLYEPVIQYTTIGE